ncbi:MAG TPA: long-chain fatty acid--CoA ligase [Candidatus Dormibacteraeota bacterium]|jgi:fatty-acyl-CoA synthase|nr:long-chain fatty acid--CoA ligase [Candidatus Dormibacteraeota bacterium]
MQGLMMDIPLTIPRFIVSRAERVFTERPVVARVGEHVHRTTWGETARRARRLAGALRDMGIRPGDRVATFAWNTHRHLEAYLAVPSMGAVLHTLNIRLFPEQVAYIVDHADDSIVLCDRSLLATWRSIEPRLDHRRPVIVLADSDDTSQDGDAPDYESVIAAAEPLEWPDIDEDQAAAMCYTSGTTGNPKGVVYSHRSTVLHSFGQGLNAASGLTARDVALAVVPMFHANCWGIPYTSAMVGASLVLPGRDLTPAGLCSLIESERVTFAAGVPTIWLGVLEYARREHPDLSSLRETLVGGSAVPPALSAAFKNELGVPIVQAWGMTETSPLGSVSRLPAEAGENPSEDVWRYYVTSIGQAMPGVEIRIVTESGEEAPMDGETMGEIQIRGPWIASAYYGGEGGDEKFVDGWLRTGDVGTIDRLGYLRIADRTKDLVKSGGEWISSVELEGLLMAHPDVLEAAVIAVPHPKWDERPLACVVPRPEARGRLTADELIDYLRPLVARWWLPDAVVFIDEVPKTSVGKFDKKVLRAQFTSIPAESRAV